MSGEIVAASGWCAPSDSLAAIMRGEFDPEIMAQVDHEMRPCGGEHRWERSQDICRECHSRSGPRRLECAGCPAIVGDNDMDPLDFEKLWEAAP